MQMRIEVAPELLPRVPDLATARAWCGERLLYVRLASGMSEVEWAARWSERVHHGITPGHVRWWERPDTPKMSMEWSIIALAMGAPEVLHWSHRLLLPHEQPRRSGLLRPLA